jgi:YVTN family beta-propeller protein
LFGERRIHKIPDYGMMTLKMKQIVLATLLISPLFAGDTVYLALLKGSNALVYLAPDGKVLTTVPVGQHPHEMAFSPDRKLLYTTDNGTMRIENPGAGGNSLSIIDVAARKKIGDIPLGGHHRPHGIDVDPKTGLLAVTTEAPDKLLIVDPVKRSVLKHFDTKGKTSHMVTFGPGAKWAYVSNSTSGTVSAINVDSGEVKLIRTGERPEGSVLSKDGKELYVVNRESNNITVIDTARNQAIANIPAGKGPVRIASTPDGSTLVYALMHEKKLAFASPKQRRQTDYVIVPGQLVSCHVSQDGKLAFASAEEDDTIFVISIPAKKIVGKIRVPQGSGPDPMLDYTLP